MKLKKLISGILATTALVGCVGTFTACETAHPEVRITVSFEGEDYELDYKLYRNFAPATVRHFLTLAENGYYDGLCVHSYADNRMYTGGYTYDAEEEENSGLVYKKYFDTVKGYANFPHSVYMDDNTPTYTLCGEFADNNVNWGKGEPKQEEYGSLTMYYKTGISTDNSIEAIFNGEHQKRSYSKNCTTSQFFISLTETAKKNSEYCTFGLLDSGDVETLNDLQEAVDAYVDDDEDATTTDQVRIYEDDVLLEGNTYYGSYTILSSPIIVKSVKVTRT